MTVPVVTQPQRDVCRTAPLRVLLWLCLGSAASVVSPVSTAAQTASLRGTIRDAEGSGIAGVYVVVAGTRLAAYTDARGAYLLNGIPAGPQRIQVHRLGYGSVEVPVELIANRAEVRDVALQLEPLPLDTVAARAHSSLPPDLQGFYARRARQTGYFFTAAEIERMQVRQLTDVLRRVPGLHLQAIAGPFGTAYAVQLGRTTGAAGARACPVLFYLNGMPFPITPDIGIDNFVRPDEISGIEVYSGTSNTPPQFAGGHPDARCGVILVWTHSGQSPVN